MLHPSIRREIAERYHRALPEEIRSYLKGRGIPATIIEHYLLGWNGERITIPVFGREGEILGFRYAKSPTDTSDSPKMLSDLGFGAELYGWDALMREPKRVVICEGEFDRLVLEANGFPAATSIAGAQTFREDWLPYFEGVKHVYICFDRDLPGITAAKKLQRLIPRARIATLPADVGEKGDVTNFFVDLGRTRLDFEMLLASAKPLEDDESADQPPVEKVREFRPAQKAMKKRADKVKRAVRVHDVAENYTELRAEGGRLVGHCPFHDDRAPSFTVYPATDTYYCFGCGAHGDVVKLVMDKESMTFGQALAALERFQYTRELYGTDS